MRPIFIRAFVLLLLVSVLPSANAQQRKNAAPVSPHLLKHLPSPLDPHAGALGDRVLIAGKERTVFIGQFLDERGKTTAVRLTLQLPGLVRMEGLAPGGPKLTFDGETRSYGNTRSEEALLEAFTSDTAEGMLTSIKEGAAVQLVGRRVGPDPAKPRDATPPYDIFEVTGPVRSGATGLVRLKQYFFASETGLLARTQYLDETFSPPMSVETRFSDWRHVEGSAYPGKIERFENGHQVFSLSVTTIAASPRQDPASFR